MLKLLGIRCEIKVTDVINHFNEMLQWYKDCSDDPIDSKLLEITNKITMSVYQYLNKKLGTAKDDSVFLQSLEQFRAKACIWNGKKYLHPDYVSFNWTTNGPYLYRLPEILERVIPLIKTLAIHLGVEPVRSILLKDLNITDDDGGEKFGQVEELTQRLNNILRDYPRDITFLKELLQNTDDAGAKSLYIILDKRNHNDEEVISQEWKELQGPALLFWNDSSFSEEDLKGIQKIGLGSKRDDPDKIGQYGIGFNVVYHFTDCPSFVTNDRLCILDPHRYYISCNMRMKPGRMYKDLDKMWHRSPGLKSSYLLNDLDEFPPEFKDGSLFRLPLQLTKKAAQKSKIVEDSAFFDLKKLESNLKDWIPEMREALLFVHNVCDVRLYVINDSRSVGILQWDDPYPVSLCSHIKSFKGKKKVLKDCV